MAKNANRNDRETVAGGRTIAKEENAENTKESKTNAGKRIKTIVIAVEIFILLILGIGLYLLRDFGKKSIVRAEFGSEEIEINEPVKENESMRGYRNVALFGVDSRSGALTKNTRSDTILIASVNLDSGEVKLVSVYRDTYLNIGEEKYDKCNAAYMYGGAKQAMEMLNRNLDLDITDFVTVGFQGLKAVVDALGGVWIDVEKAEIVHLNNYQVTMADELGGGYTPVKEPGYQLLDGLQAVAYCRIRYTKGDDFKRTQRQREVIAAIAQQALSADLKTLIDVATQISESGAVYTSLDSREIIELLGEIKNYQIADETGFPAQKHLTTAKMGSAGDCVIPENLEENVVLLHEFLFGATEYQVSGEVREYSEKIRDKVEKYAQN